MTIATKYYEPIYVTIYCKCSPFLNFWSFIFNTFCNIEPIAWFILNNSPPKNIMVILYNANHKQMHLTTIKSDLNKNTLCNKSPIFLFTHLLYKTPVFNKNLPKTNLASLN